MNAFQLNDALEGRILTVLESSRQKQGISVAELARRIGIGKKRLWYVLNGQRACLLYTSQLVAPSIRAYRFC